MLLTVPPLVNAPLAAVNPTNSPTHATAWFSSCVAARASTARLMSYVWDRRSASVPISSPLDPMNAKYRGRAWAIDSSRMRAASSRASWTGVEVWGRLASRSRRTRSSSGGSSGRNRSKLRHASATSFTACSSASSRGASSRSGRSGSIMTAMVRLPSGSRLRSEIGERLARRLAALHGERDDQADHEQGDRVIGSELRRARHRLALRHG